MSTISENLLELEYNYIKETIHQSVEDRYRLLNFYIAISTTVGTIGLGIITFAQSDFSDLARIGISILALLIAVIGWLFIAMMIRLRQAWWESLIAMNRLKDFVITSQPKKFAKAFLWSAKTIPRKNKLWTIHFYSTALVVFVSSLSLAVGSSLMLGHESVSRSLLIGLSVLLVSSIVLIYVYWHKLRQ